MRGSYESSILAMSGGRTRKFDDIDRSAIYNDNLFSHYFNTFYELALNRFKWKNLPDKIPPRYIEQTLCDNALAIFFHDDVDKTFKCLSGTATGFDVYFNPTHFNVIGGNGYSNNELDTDNAVVIWNNFTRTNDLFHIYLFAYSVWDLFVSAMVNAGAQKTPVLIEAESENVKLSLQQVYMKYSGNQPVIFAKGKHLTDSLNVLKTDAPYVADKLIDLKDRIIEEFFKWLGVRMPLINGRERLVAGEQRDANQVTYQLRNRGLQSRQLAIDEINEKWGLNISVEFDEELSEDATGILKSELGNMPDTGVSE